MLYPDLISNVKPSIAFVSLFDADNELLGSGSGFVFGAKNILVTCNHVVSGSSAILLKFPDSEKYISGKVIVADEEHDLALLKFDDSSRNPILMEDLGKVVEGMSVVFSGYPFSSKNLTTHQGIISAITKDATGITSFLIDGTVNSGNSGCPLLSTDGKVIGVINAKGRSSNELLQKVEKLKTGALSLYGVDIVKIFRALVDNVQIGVGYAVPANYIPEHKEM